MPNLLCIFGPTTSDPDFRIVYHPDAETHKRHWKSDQDAASTFDLPDLSLKNIFKARAAGGVHL